MLAEDFNYRKILRQELERRCRQNSRYSLRAFARDLKISPSRLSEILNEKQGLSRSSAHSIAAILGYTGKDQDYFCDLVDSMHARSKIRKQIAKARLVRQQQIESGVEQITEVGIDSFKIISDWYHFAILELINVKDFNQSPEFIAKKLSITENQAASAIERLKKTGLLTEENGVLKRAEGYISTPEGKSSEPLVEFQKQVLRKALSALEKTHPEKSNIHTRDFSTVFVAVDSQALPLAKQKLQRFRRKFSKWLESYPEKDRVYSLSLQFFDLTDTE